MADLDAMSAAELWARAMTQEAAARRRHEGEPVVRRRSPAVASRPEPAPVRTDHVMVHVRAGRPVAVWRNGDTETVPLLGTLDGLVGSGDDLAVAIELTDGSRWTVVLADGEPWTDDPHAERVHVRASSFELPVVAGSTTGVETERWVVRSTSTDGILGFPAFLGLPAAERHDHSREGRP